MWFGTGIFAWIPREVLLSFPLARRIEKTETGQVFIELYDDPHACEEPSNRAIQQAFRDHVAMDAVAAQIRDRTDADPVFSIERGKFPHGGVRLISKWVDRFGKPVVRSRANRRIVLELDALDQVLWSATVDESHEGESLGVDSR
jgi:hypothetical protein